MAVFGPYPGKVLRIVDADTLQIDLDLGFGTHQTALFCRVYGVNAPERYTDAGKVAIAFVTALLPLGSPVEVLSHGWDKYGGRYDGEIRYGPDRLSLADALIASGNAVAATY